MASIITANYNWELDNMQNFKIFMKKLLFIEYFHSNMYFCLYIRKLFSRWSILNA